MSPLFSLHTTLPYKHIKSNKCSKFRKINSITFSKLENKKTRNKVYIIKLNIFKRGKSKYHYYGIRIRESSLLHTYGKTEDEVIEYLKKY